MKIKYMIIFLILLTAVSYPAKLVLTGFKDENPKTEFITGSFVEFLRGNLEDAGFELIDDKSEGLEYALLKHGNFFLASKDFFDEYENIDLDNSIHGEVDYRGKYFYLTVQVYSREKKRLVLKGEVKGSKEALLAFYYEVTKSIISSMDVEHTVKNVFPVDDDKFFYKYIKYAHDIEQLFQSDDPDKYYSLVDELEAMKPHFSEFPVFQEMYEDLEGQSEDFELAGPFEKPITDKTKFISGEDNEIEKYERDLITNGYIFSFRETVQTVPEDEPEVVNLLIKFDIKMKKSSRNSLISEIKKRKGNPHFSDMGRFFFSQNESENKTFRDFLLRQSVMLRFFDSEGQLIAESEYYFDKRAYSNGEYRHAKSLPFPLTPRGPANTAFGMKGTSRIQFIFDEMKRSDMERIESTEIELIFD